MLRWLVELREPVESALASSEIDIFVYTVMLLGAYLSCLHSMKPLWSYQRKKAIQLKSSTIIKVVEQKLQEEAIIVTIPLARELGEHLIMLLWGTSLNLWSICIILLATVLDPRYKSISPTEQSNNSPTNALILWGLLIHNHLQLQHQHTHRML